MLCRTTNSPPAPTGAESDADSVAAARRARKAANQHEYRERKAAGRVCVKVEIGRDVIAALVRRGELEQADAEDPALLALVLCELLERFVTGNAADV